MDNGSIAQRHESVPIADITIPRGRRHVDQEKVKSLARSVSRIGLLHPVTITKDYRLVCGEHRIEAYKLLKLATIDCVIVDADELLLELAEIDENCDRNVLTALEWSQALKRRKEIYEALNGQIQRGGDRKSESAKSKAQNEPLIPFVQDASEHLGVSEATVKRDVKIAEDISPEVQETIKDTLIADSKKELAALAKLSEAQQKKAAKKLASGKATTVAEATATEPKKPDQLLDANKQPVPGKLKPVFEHAKEFDELCRQLHAVSAAIEKLCGEPHGAHLHCQSVTADIDNAKRALRFAKPYAVCPYCKAKNAEKCPACKGHGWVGKNLFKAAPEEMKA